MSRSRNSALDNSVSQLSRADDLLRKLLLALNERVDALLKGASTDVLVNLDIAVLTDPVRPVRRLILNGPGSPAVEVEHVGGTREIEARARPRPSATAGRWVARRGVGSG